MNLSSVAYNSRKIFKMYDHWNEVIKSIHYTPNQLFMKLKECPRLSKIINYP
jgi:hypothetical protein